MASDLEVLTLIPHSAANHPSACWTSRSDVANRTSSFAKRRDAILSPNRTLPSPQLALEILSMKITNRRDNLLLPLRTCLICAENTDTALTLCVQGPDGTYQWLWYPILLQYPPQDSQQSSDSASSSEDVLVRFRSSEPDGGGGKCSFPCLPISSVWVSSSPPQLSTA